MSEFYDEKTADEFSDPISNEFSSGNWSINKKKSGGNAGNKNKRKMFSGRKNILLQFGAIFSAAVMVYSAFGVDLLGYDMIFNSDSGCHHDHYEDSWYYDDEPGYTDDDPWSSDDEPGYTDDEPWSPPEGPVEVPSGAVTGSSSVFPSLPNLGIGSPIQEDYIYFSSEDAYLHINPSLGINFGVSVKSVDHASYDAGTNTLTLDEYVGDKIVCNLMGNGLTLNISGTVRIRQLIVYGFFYGGSLKIDGSGILQIGTNQESAANYGILIDGEQSVSCLMIGNDITGITVYGTESAIVVCNTAAEYGIYWNSDVFNVYTNMGTYNYVTASQETVPFNGLSLQTEGENCKDWTFVSPNGNATRIEFSRTN